MTPEERAWIVDLIAKQARMSSDLAAQCQVLKELLAETIAANADPAEATTETILKAIDQQIQKRCQKYLLKVEETQPGMAALMDKDQPPPPLEDDQDDSASHSPSQ